MQKDLSKFINECVSYVRDLEFSSVLPSQRHSIVVPYASYSPWLSDADFSRVFETLRANTLVDVYRCHELWELVAQTAHLGGDILEVGVWRGGTGCLMAAKAKALGSSSAVFLADTFSGVVKAGRMDPSYSGGEHRDTSVDLVLAAKSALGLDNIEILVGIFPEDTGDLVRDRTFSLCHIDVDVYTSGKDVFEWVWPRLKVGGVVVFDDYGFSTTSGITTLVNELKTSADALVVHNLNGHAVLVKVR